MENKYYTPEIEEFHVGFEYQVPIGLDEDERNYIKLTWDEHCKFEDVFNISYDDGVLAEITVPKCYKVKYLDREDIEECGFYYIKECDDLKNKQNTFKKTKSDDEIYCFVFDYGLSKITISVHDKNLKYNGNIQRVFNGEIKNKSELKRLLKQLGI